MGFSIRFLTASAEEGTAKLGKACKDRPFSISPKTSRNANQICIKSHKHSFSMVFGVKPSRHFDDLYAG
jgi:hypothetical protein